MGALSNFEMIYGSPKPHIFIENGVWIMRAANGTYGMRWNSIREMQNFYLFTRVCP
jgi:hypothetical protein